MADYVGEIKMHKTFITLAEKCANDMVHTLGLSEHNPFVIGLQEDEMDDQVVKLIKNKLADYRALALKCADKFDTDVPMASFVTVIIFEMIGLKALGLSDALSPTAPELNATDAEIEDMLDGNNAD